MPKQPSKIKKLKAEWNKLEMSDKDLKKLGDLVRKGIKTYKKYKFLIPPIAMPKKPKKKKSILKQLEESTEERKRRLEQAKNL